MKPEQRTQDFSKYLKLVAKKREVIAAIAIAVSLSFIIYCYVAPKTYEAKSTVLIEGNVINNLVEGIAVTPSMDERLKNISTAMTSRALIMSVINKLDWDLSVKDPAKKEKLIENLQDRMEIEIPNAKSSRKVDMFIVSFRDRDPQRARDYVNTIVSEFIEFNVSAKREESYGANRFLAEQIADFKEKIDKVDRDIIAFRKQKGIFSVIDEHKIVDEINAQDQKINELNMQKMELEAKRTMIQKQLKEEKPYTVTMMSRRTGESLPERLMMLEKKLSNLLTKYTDNYPEVISVRSEIEYVRNQIREQENPKPSPDDNPLEVGSLDEMSSLNPLYQQLREESSKIDFEIAGINAKKTQIERIIEEKKNELRNLPEEKKKLVDLERERDSYKDIHEKLVTRLSQSEVSKEMQLQDKTETFRVVDPAVTPLRPVSPNRLKIILLGVFIGIACGIGFVILVDNIRDSFHSADAVRDFGLPVLAVIPKIKTLDDKVRQKKRDSYLIAFSSSYAIFVISLILFESIRTVS